MASFLTRNFAHAHARDVFLKNVLLLANRNSQHFRAWFLSVSVDSVHSRSIESVRVYELPRERRESALYLPRYVSWPLVLDFNSVPYGVESQHESVKMMQETCPVGNGRRARLPCCIRQNCGRRIGLEFTSSSGYFWHVYPRGVFVLFGCTNSSPASFTLSRTQRSRRNSICLFSERCSRSASSVNSL